MKTVNWLACAAMAGALFVLTGCQSSPAGDLQARFRGTRFTITACSDTVACEGPGSRDNPCHLVGWTLAFIADVTDDGTANRGRLSNPAGAGTEFGWRARVEEHRGGAPDSYLKITMLPIGDGSWRVDHFRPWPADPDKEELELISSWLDSDGCRHTARIVAILQK